MALEKVTPIHIAIHNIDEMISQLRLRRAEFVALLPQKPKVGQQRVRFITNPYTNKKEQIKKRELS